MTHQACVACGAAVPVRSGQAASVASLSIGSSRRQARSVEVSVCPSCGLGFQDPRPTAEELTALYAGLVDEAYTDETGPRQLAASLSARLLRRYAGATRGRLLDVGCATGIFLDAAARDGWQVEGVEPSDYLRAHALPSVRGRILPGVLADVGADGARDVVTFWDVLEHVDDPRASLAHAAEMLRPGGLLIVNVPDRSSVLARAFGDRWPLLLPEHLYYFTPDSLGALLRSVGFEPLGTHLHPVFFRLHYVLHRLAQHLPDLAALGWLSRSALGDVPVPLLMGEVTMVARRG